jgi:hypothetical protein
MLFWPQNGVDRLKLADFEPMSNLKTCLAFVACSGHNRRDLRTAILFIPFGIKGLAWSFQKNETGAVQTGA